MSWFRADDSLAFHAKVVAAGNAAMGLWIRAGAWSAHQLTDGFVPKHMVNALGRPGEAKRLVDMGLWVAEDGGYRFHDWLEYQPSAEEVRADQASKHEAKVRAGRVGGIASGVARRKHTRSTAEADGKQTGSSAHPAAGEAGKQNEAPSHPIPTTEPKGSAQPAKETTAATLIGEWIDHCGDRPPGRVIGQVSKELKAMLDEGIPACDVRAGLMAWHDKGLHPSTLASVVHETRTSHQRNSGRPSRPMPADEMNHTLALGARLAAEQNTQHNQIGAA